MVDIGGIIDRLLPLVEERVKSECNMWVNTETEAGILLSNLKEIQDVLEEAEKRRLVDPRVRSWLERLRDVMYEIDDALDEWKAANHRLRIHDNTLWKKINNFIHPFRSCIHYISRGRAMALHIKELNAQVDSLSQETIKYNMIPINSDDSQDVACENTTSFSDLIKIPGQQKNKKELVDALLTPQCREPSQIQVISLVGMPGIGKTTVAQLAFREVQFKFELSSWVCISHNSDMVWVTKAILQSLDVNYPVDADLQKLLKLVKESVSEKKFLIVLDQVWIDDDNIWNQLKASLWYGAPGSRIVVTSRYLTVSALMGSKEINVDELSKGDCWLLFSKIAFHRRSEWEKEKLEGIGKRIAEKCKGLPLAAKTLGYYLQVRDSKELWDDVVDKELWQLDEVAQVLFAPFTFSYNMLSLALKQCFSYCSIYPDDVQIDVDELIRLWMVQGYLSSSATDSEMELKGRDYFEKLVRSCFFNEMKIHYSSENFASCKIHGILLDFARYLAKSGSKVEELRSFIFQDKLPPIELGTLKSIRVLILKGSKLKNLPPGIENLIHLRYIDLSSTPIEELPPTICYLHNLQCMDLRNCKKLSKLPKRIHRLRKLRHLLVRGSYLARVFPRGLEKLIDLQTLDQYVVVRGGSKFGYLARLNQLRGSIWIALDELNEKEDVEDARKADLKSKIHMSDLTLTFTGEVKIDVLESLQVPPNLLCFTMLDYRGTQFPRWISNSLNKVTTLRLVDCNKCSDLPLLGTLPFLEMLIIDTMKSLQHVGRQFLGIMEGNDPSSVEVIFPKLSTLYFEKCESWEEWEDISTEDEASSTLSIMPCLLVLTIKSCSKLEGLPHLFLRKATSLSKLEVTGCPLLSRRYRHFPGPQEMENDWKSVSHIKFVEFSEF